MKFYSVLALLILFWSIFIFHVTSDLDKTIMCVLCSVYMYELGLTQKLENENIRLKEELHGKSNVNSKN